MDQNLEQNFLQLWFGSAILAMNLWVTCSMNLEIKDSVRWTDPWSEYPEILVGLQLLKEQSVNELFRFCLRMV